jgi:hypothetical protein
MRRISQLMLILGNSPELQSEFDELNKERIQALGGEEEANKVSASLKAKQKGIWSGSYTDWFGWGSGRPSGGWPSSKGGMMRYNEDGTDDPVLGFGRRRRKIIAKKGEFTSEFYVKNRKEEATHECGSVIWKRNKKGKMKKAHLQQAV